MTQRQITRALDPRTPAAQATMPRTTPATAMTIRSTWRTLPLTKAEASTASLAAAAASFTRGARRRTALGIGSRAWLWGWRAAAGRTARPPRRRGAGVPPPGPAAWRARPMRTAVLVSGRPPEAAIDDLHHGSAPRTVVAVVRGLGGTGSNGLRPPALPRSWRAPRTTPTGERNRALERALHHPTGGAFGGLHGASWTPKFVAAFPGPRLTRTRCCCRSFPGAHAVRDALARGRQAHGATVHEVVDVDAGPILATGCRGPSPGHRGHLHAAHQHGRAAAARGLPGRPRPPPAGPRHRAAPATAALDWTGRRPVPRTVAAAPDHTSPRLPGESVNTSDLNRVPLKRALISVYDKDRPRGARPGCTRPAWTSSPPAPPRRPSRPPGSPRPRWPRSRLPGVPATAGQDPAPARARRGPRRTAASREHVQQLSELEIEPFDLVVVNLYPFQDTVRSVPARTTWWSRSTSAGPPWCGPPPRTTPPSPWSWTPPATPTWRAPPRRAATTSPPAEARCGRFAHTAAYDTAVATWTAQQFSRRPGG
ncbi:hypothetical protein QJS66_08835 [Kocuria rhizophila]|nr:hypothetical protein QJS66_08835 [Kocuria rhizophila]